MLGRGDFPARRQSVARVCRCMATEFSAADHPPVQYPSASPNPDPVPVAPLVPVRQSRSFVLQPCWRRCGAPA
jgi:hypothetical protein